MRAWLLLAVTIVTLPACKKDQPTAPAPSASVSAAAAPSSSDVPAASASAVAPSGKMAHCPSAIDGSTTTITDVEGGVAVAITGTSPDMTSQIRARSQALLDASKNQDATVHHNGTGEGGGQFGRCPIVMRNTTLELTSIDNGSKIVVKPETPKELDWLRRETRDRYAELKAPNSAGAGTGRMLHCPSAADGASTLVADVPGGVTLTVTGKSDAQAADIRARVKHLLDVAKDPAPSGAHDGNGNGNGGIGRCPVVLVDTTLTAKDVTNGSAITVKSTKPQGVDGLRRETRDRLTNFSAPPSASGAPSATQKP